MEHERVFEKACLIQLTTSTWSASKSVDPVLLRQLGENSDWIKGRKNLINPELLGQIKTSAHQARNKVKQYALPFPILSIQLVPKEYIQTIEDLLQHYRTQFWGRVDAFEQNYAEAREEAREMLGSLFNEMDYPADIRSKFRFGWQFLALQVPSQTTILSPEIYERERQRFENLMGETRDLCVNALRTEFSELLGSLVDKLSVNGSKPKKIVTNSMFNKLNEFFNDLQTKNLFNDQELNRLADEARAIIDNVSPYGLKYNQDARDSIKSEMEILKQTVENAIVDMPTRLIRMDHQAA